MDDKDKKEFLKDFSKADINKKMDMWFYALNQETLWEEIIAEMADYAQKKNLKQQKIIQK
jgi:hypothetical protein